MADTTAVDIIAEEDLPEFSELVRMYQRRVFSVAYHFLHERTIAEEVAQDVFMQLYRCPAVHKIGRACNRLAVQSHEPSMHGSRPSAALEPGA